MVNFKSKHTKSNKSFFSTNVFLALLGICLVVASVYLWKTQVSRNLSQIASSTEAKARSYSSETEIRYNSIYHALDRLASRGVPRDEADTGEWAKDAAFYIDAFVGIKNIALVDETFHIRQIVPLQDNLPYMNQRASEVNGDPTEINLWVPIHNGKEFNGFILGTIAIDAFISPVLSEINNDYMLQLSDERVVIFKSENWSPPQEGFIVRRIITLKNTTVLNLTFAPTDELLDSGIANAHKTLIFSLLFSFITIIAVYFAQNFSATATISTSRYRNLFEASQDAIFIINLKGEYRDANPAATKMVGYSLTELQQKTVDDLRIQSEMPSPDVRSRMWTEGGMQEISLRHKDGHTIPVDLVTSPIREGDVQKYVLGIARDITERVRAEEKLAQYTQQLETLNTVTAALSTSLELDSVLKLILDQIGEVLPLDSGTIFLHEKDGLRVVMDRGITPSAKGHLFPTENELFKEIEQTGEPLILDNVKEDSRFYKWATSGNVAGWMGVPLIVRDTLTGFLTLDSLLPGVYSFEQADLALSFASQAAQAIENARQFNAAQRRMKWLNALRKIDQTITSGFDLKMTLDVLLEHLLEQLDVDAAAALLYNASLQTFTFIQGAGFRTTALQHTHLRLGKGYAGKVALQRGPVFISDLDQDENAFSESPEFKKEKFAAYYGVPLITKGVLVGVLEIFNRSPLDPKNEWLAFLETLAGQAAIAIDNVTLFNDLQRSNTNLLQAYDATIEGWAHALELRDMETEGHSRRVVDLTMELAQRMDISDEHFVHIRRGALLHDIGKMGVPDAILQKPGKLTEEEWQIMRQHPVYAYEWLSSIEYLRPALDIPHYHHERWDGTGYPHGLKGEQIPIAARIFAIVDVWDALRSDRPYRKAWSKEKTLAYLQEQSGKHFDPQVVKVFLEVIHSR